MGFFIGRSIIYTLLSLICVLGFWIYALFFAEEPSNYFSFENLQVFGMLSVVVGATLAFFDPAKFKGQQELASTGGKQFSNSKPDTRSSKAAKAGLILGAAAYAKASHKPKFPVCTPRDHSLVRNIQTQHLGGNKWRIFCETKQSENHWRNFQHDITPSVGGFSADRTSIDVIWK